MGVPGIVARIGVTDESARQSSFVTDESWKAILLTAWRNDVPRRNYATGWMECFEAEKEPIGWRELEFNDSAWPVARVVDPGDVRYFPRMVPHLREFFARPERVFGEWSIPAGVPTLDEVTRGLDKEPWTPVTLQTEFPIVIEAGPTGTALGLDLGGEVAGQVEVEVDGPAGITIDLCLAEPLRGNRPWCHRRGEYAKRYITRAGRQAWRSFGYDGGRYLTAVIRGPHPRITLHRLGVWRRETDLPFRASFECDDEKVNRIWQITRRTMAVGAQDVHIDCPTREQTSAWGDHLWSGLWEGFLTGDFSHLRHLVTVMEQVQWPNGQMPCYAFSGIEPYPLYDYALICVMGLWEYFWATGDRELIERVLPTALQILARYRREIGPSGLIEIDGDRAMHEGQGQLFIDHPGLGHNHPLPWLDRRGIGSCLNFFFVLALESAANLCNHLDRPDQALALRKEADAVRHIAEKMFFDPARGAYSDNVFEGHLSNHLSQQANALAVLSETCPPERARTILTRILDPNDANLCRCGTYFWTYVTEAMCRQGMHETMWAEVVRLWDDMAERGATTWWETFQGGELDSLCHIWSSVPGYLIVAYVLGVQPAAPGFRKIAVRPQIGLLNRVKGFVPIGKGGVEVAWETLSPAEKKLCIKNGTPFPSAVFLPEGWTSPTTGTPPFDLDPSEEILLLCRLHNGRGF